jgi:hypothetical protein
MPVVSPSPISKISASSSISARLPVTVPVSVAPWTGLDGFQPLWLMVT